MYSWVTTETLQALNTTNNKKQLLQHSMVFEKALHAPQFVSPQAEARDPDARIAAWAAEADSAAPDLRNRISHLPGLSDSRVPSSAAVVALSVHHVIGIIRAIGPILCHMTSYNQMNSSHVFSRDDVMPFGSIPASNSGV